MTLLTEHTDLTHNGKVALGKTGVKTLKVGWTDDKLTVPDAD
ncbi:hypothetical protein ACIBO5_56070 [Nonomuraea angiospora]